MTATHPAPTGELRHCGSCGKMLPVPAGPGRRATYCSDKCRYAGNRNLRRAGRPPVLPAAATSPNPFQAKLAEVIGSREVRMADVVAGMGKYGRSASTISNWQRGAYLPPRTVEATRVVLSLERALRLQPGELLRALREARRANQPSTETAAAPTRDRRQDLGVRKALIERRIRGEKYGALSRDGILAVAVAEKYVVGKDGRAHHSDIDLTLLAIADGAFGYWYFRSAAAGSTVRVEPLDGCVRGLSIDDARQYPDTPEYLNAVELLFDEPLVAGETRTIRYRVKHDHTGSAGPIVREHEFRLVLPHLASRSLTGEIEFAASYVPRHLIRSTWQTDRPDQAGIAVFQEELVHQRRDRQDVANPDDIGYGWRWCWPDEECSCPQPGTARRRR